MLSTHFLNGSVKNSQNAAGALTVTKTTSQNLQTV